MQIWREEVFGPVLCVKEFSTEEEAIELANDTQWVFFLIQFIVLFNLAAYVYTLWHMNLFCYYYFW